MHRGCSIIITTNKTYKEAKEEETEEKAELIMHEYTRVKMCGVYAKNLLHLIKHEVQLTEEHYLCSEARQHTTKEEEVISQPEMHLEF